MKNIEYYMRICDEIAQMSKCLSRKIGVIILTPDYTIVNSGYNGPARKVSHCDSPDRLDWIVKNVKDTHYGNVKEYLIEKGWGTKCPRQMLGFKSGEGLWFCQAGHAERNAIVNCAREGIRTKGNWMVMNCALPCHECAKEIVGAGIVKIICKKGPDYDPGSRWILNQAGVEITQV